MNQIYLLWNSYATKQLLPIGSLIKINQYYIFQYNVEALEAQKQGCVLPFPYTEENYYYLSLPAFFENRKINSEFIKNLNISGLEDEFGILLINHGQRNGDNFVILSEQEYKSLAKDGRDKQFNV